MERSATSSWLKVEGLRVHCLRAGTSGSPVVLLHGGGIDSARFSYRHTLGALSRHHRVFAPDWPGYGESDKPQGAYDLDYYSRFLGPLLDALELAQAHLVGISLGGGAALGFALASPGRVERLGLVGSYGLGREIPWGWLGYLLVKLPLVGELSWATLRSSRQALRWSLRYLVHDKRVVTEEMVAEAYGLIRQPGAGRTFRAFQRSELDWRGLRTDFSERLGELEVPTLIVHGEHDPAVPVAWARQAKERIPDSELCIFPDCGHMVPRERPARFNEVLGEFLARS